MKSVNSKSSITQHPFFVESIFQHVTDGILVIDAKGMIVQANPATLAMTGYTEEEIKRLHICTVCQGMATCIDTTSCIDCFFHRAKLSSFEMTILTKAGHELPVSASATRLPNLPEPYMVIILRDLSLQQWTERERFQRTITTKIIEAQEEERKRISRDLHDGVGQALYSILIGLKVVNHLELDQETKNHLLEVQRMTEQTMEEVKKLAVDLRPSTLDDLGLLPAIRSYIKRYEETFGINVDLSVTGKIQRYSSALETAVYRICQEAMNNAAKYADTDKINLSIQERNGQIQLIIEDFGVGFDTGQALQHGGAGLGLHGMKERADLLGGSFQIHSTVGKGTIINVTIPIQQREESIHDDSNSNRG